ncbi:sulfite exporter TauE/SafE family protein [Basilea psittacipulmonis]|uniref:Probable membrane transporter protein n=1 Tax=Basilea psittacipulmonis DSM 24701 TaxID=1072685 RepID=A0A077DJA7_9BURK|nr:sulfite exporter TauE/SafE family protein [Basilea psittacipulmonis]AIL33188.1 hypothetical protein IX83_07685 [Basilea psittacipulmonis DSM 24701]
MILDFLPYIVIFIVGFLAGVVNIMAAGGSFVTIPVLMLLGLDANIANGTNRVGIFIQSLAGLKGFSHANKVPSGHKLWGILIPCALGGLSGSLLVAYLPKEILKPILLIVMLIAATFIAVRKNLFAQHHHEPLDIKDRPIAIFYLFLGGVYGGFIQAGVGIILLLICAELLRYDIVRANALKLICTLIFTIVSLVIFVIYDQIHWGWGITLGIGNALGALLGIRVMIHVNPKFIRLLLFIVAVIAIVWAYFSG